MPRAIAIAGYRDSGKTSVIEGLIKELVRRGHRVATVKHVSEEPTLDKSGKDTWRHARAGANPVVCVGPKEVVTVERGEAKLEDVLRRLGDADFVLLEGFKGAKNVPKVMVARDEGEASKLDDESTVAFVGSGEGKPVLAPDDVKGLADLVEEKALEAAGEARVVLTVDGKRVNLNPFMQNLVSGTISGMMSALKGADGKRIELRVVKGD